jgi:hypothetical protein
MNQFLPSRYVETIERLALGIEPMDALHARPLSYELQVEHEASLAGLRRPPVERHTSNRYALRYQPGVTTPLDLRFFDLSERVYSPEHDRRRIVPRRLRIPILSLADVETQELTEAQAANKNAKDFKRRVRRPVFFPGAAYDFTATATGLRGRVIRDGQPMRWARVVATLASTSVVVGRAHGDDRGEFLLLINSAVTTGGATPKPLRIDVSVVGPATAPAPPVPDTEKLDPLWDLPLEILAAPGINDAVATGEQLPDQPPAQNYTATITRTVEFTLGKCLSGLEDFVIT